MITTQEDTSDYKVIGNGSFITYNQKPIRLRVSNDADDPDPLFIEVSFENDLHKQEEHINSTIDGDLLKLVLTNYNNLLGSGTSEPVRIGVLDEKTSIYINFRCYGNMDADKLFFYTLYAIEEVNSENSAESAPKKSKKGVKNG